MATPKKVINTEARALVIDEALALQHPAMYRWHEWAQSHKSALRLPVDFAEEILSHKLFFLYGQLPLPSNMKTPGGYPGVCFTLR